LFTHRFTVSANIRCLNFTLFCRPDNRLLTHITASRLCRRWLKRMKPGHRPLLLSIPNKALAGREFETTYLRPFSAKGDNGERAACVQPQ
jgi:hypothetical protein